MIALVVSKSSFQVAQLYNIERNEIVSTCDACTEIYGGCDFAIDCLIIGTKTPILQIWRIKWDPVEAIKHKEFRINTKSPITSIKLNQGRDYFAIGCESGSIDLYSFGGLSYLNTLQSNRNSPINDMVFSPWTTASKLPIILVSISDQICYWNISYVDNNPIENGALRRSQRFDRKASVRLITEKMLELKPSNGNGYGMQSSNPWTGKLGPTEKPELLACIQLIGNSADQIFSNKNFTKFVTIDDEGMVHKCFVCGKSFTRNIILVKHMASHSSENTVSPSAKPNFPCDYCSKIYTRKAYLKAHISIHTKESQHKCSHCDKLFTRKEHLLNHTRTHTGETPFKCELCSDQFMTKKLLKSHLFGQCRKPTSFICYICSKEFRKQSSVTNHISRTHSTDGKFKCSECSKRFVVKQNLIFHMRSHKF